MVNLSTNRIAEMGNKIMEVLNDNKLRNSELRIYVDKESFLKIDEDLYYRQNPEGTDFVQSIDEIQVVFDNLKLSIIKT